ncbi:MAG: phage portal protein [Clostridia bacterium]|nr:phage portal protein [Clostridia bacterium]
MELKGRREIFTDVTEITKENICKVIDEAFETHLFNAAEIEYLQNYEKGKQPILNRVKKVRPEINFKAVENHATEITTFKVGYVFGSPITYVQRASVDLNGNKAEVDDKAIAILNEMMFEESKASKDKTLGKDISVCGVGYRIVLPKKEKSGISAIDVLRLNPKTTFIVKANNVYQRVLLAASYVITSDNVIKMGVYTRDAYYELEKGHSGFKVLNVEQNLIGIPIIQYKNDDERMGCFERVIPLLDALNEATSDRLNGLSQFIQSILWMNNCEIDSDQMNQLKDKLGLLTKSEPGNAASVQYLTATLDQSQTQTLIDYLYEQILQIAGVPGREQSTGGNTGQAILLSNGWQIAETQAKNLEQIFSESEREMLKVVLKICSSTQTNEIANLKLSDIDIKFSRNRTDSLLVKTQGLMNQLQAGIHPLVAITNCGLYSDPQGVWNDSKAYMGKWLYDTEEDEVNDEDTVSDNRRSGGEDNQEATPTVQT